MDKSPLRKLAPELRKTICELILIAPQPIDVHLVGNIPHVQGSQSKDLRARLPLTTTSKKIHAETNPVFYGANRFVIHVKTLVLWGPDVRTASWPAAYAELAKERSYVLRGWVHQLGPSFQHLRSFELSLGSWKTFISVTPDVVYSVSQRFAAVFADSEASLAMMIRVGWMSLQPHGDAEFLLALVPRDVEATRENVRQGLEHLRSETEGGRWSTFKRIPVGKPEKMLRTCESQLGQLLDLMQGLKGPMPGTEEPLGGVRHAP